MIQARQAAPLLEGWSGWRVDQLHAVERRLGLRAPEVGTVDLTPREAEVAALLAGGHSNAAIGRKLYISPKTVSVHVSNILSKLGMSGRAEVAAWAVREGLAPPAT
jgi:DNA-binding CsgD family transcriptional regulator